jgi:hypothetical protein
MVARFLNVTAVAFAVVAVLAQTAVAAGEPKNESPFTRLVGARTPQVAVNHAVQAGAAIQGEPKNEAPFTSPATVVVASGGSGFDWSSGGIGVAAGLGIALSGAGAARLVRRSPRTA